MSIVHRCPKCSRETELPDLAAGKKFKCPDCRTASKVAAALPETAEIVHPLDVSPDLIAAELASAAMVESPLATPSGWASTDKTAGTRLRERRLKKQARSPGGLRRLLASQGLVLTTLVVGCGFFLVNFFHFRTQAGAIAGIVGIIAAIGLAKSQSAELYADSDGWFFIETWSGRIVFGAVALLAWLGIGYVWLNVLLHIDQIAVWKPLIIAFVTHGVFLAIVSAICVAGVELSRRFGFFRTLSWGFLVVAVGWPGLAWAVRESTGGKSLWDRNTWAGKSDEPSSATPNSAAKKSARRPIVARPPGSSRRVDLLGNPISPDAAPDAAESGSDFPAASKRPQPARPVPIPWHVAVDGGDEPALPIPEWTPLIPTWGATISYADSQSWFVTVHRFFGEDGKEAERELWDLRLARKVGSMSAKIDFHGQPQLSRDGKFLAGDVGNGTYEVWSFTNGELAGRIALENVAQSQLLGFVGNDQLLLSTRSNESPSQEGLELWNVANRRRVWRYAPGTALPVTAWAFSPGWRYVAVNAPGSIRFVDLASGEAAGELIIPAQYATGLQVNGIAFGSNGSELACLAGQGRHSRLLAWNLADRSLFLEHEFALLFSGFDGPALQTFADNSGWLIQGRAIVSRKPGKHLWPRLIPSLNETLAGRQGLRSVRIVGGRRLLLTGDRGISAIGLGPTTSNQIVPRDQLVELQTILNRNPLPQTPGWSREPFARRFESFLFTEDIGKRAQDYLTTVHGELLAGDDRLLSEQLSFWPAARRPKLGLRWGIAIEYAGRDAPAVRNFFDLERLTGPLGVLLRNGLQARIDRGDFGLWPQIDDPRLRELAFLGVGPRKDIVSYAQQLGLDMVVCVAISGQGNPNGRLSDLVMLTTLVDPRGAVAEWSSSPLRLSDVAAAGDAAHGLAERKANEVLAKIDGDHALRPMPALTAAQVEKRLQRLSRETSSDPWSVLAEVRYYLVQRLVSKEAAIARLDAVAPGQGAALADDQPSVRRSALKAIIGLLEPGTGPAPAKRG